MTPAEVMHFCISGLYSNCQAKLHELQCDYIDDECLRCNQFNRHHCNCNICSCKVSTPCYSLALFRACLTSSARSAAAGIFLIVYITTSSLGLSPQDDVIDAHCINQRLVEHRQ